jgi:hypothetical protein
MKQEELFWFIGQYITLGEAPVLTTFYLRPGVTLCRSFFFIIIIIFVLFSLSSSLFPLSSKKEADMSAVTGNLRQEASEDKTCGNVMGTYACSVDVLRVTTQLPWLRETIPCLLHPISSSNICFFFKCLLFSVLYISILLFQTEGYWCSVFINSKKSIINL